MCFVEVQDQQKKFRNLFEIAEIASCSASFWGHQVQSFLVYYRWEYFCLCHAVSLLIQGNLLFLLLLVQI